MRSIVAVLLEAADVAAVRVGWWHFGARRTSRQHAERIELGTLDAVDWDRVFTIELRRAHLQGTGRTLRDVALGIPSE